MNMRSFRLHRPGEEEKPLPPDAPWWRWPVATAIKEALVLQFITHLMAGMILCDGPVEVCLAASGGWLVGTLCICGRRGRAPTTADLGFIRAGFVLLLPVVLTLWGLKSGLQ